MRPGRRVRRLPLSVRLRSVTSRLSKLQEAQVGGEVEVTALREKQAAAQAGGGGRDGGGA